MNMKKFISTALCILLMAGTVSAGPKKDIREVVFDTYLHCADCVKKVEENISFEKGVKALDVSLREQKITIKYDASKTSVEKLETAIRKLGYKASVQKPEKPR